MLKMWGMEYRRYEKTRGYRLSQGVERLLRAKSFVANATPAPPLGGCPGPWGNDRMDTSDRASRVCHESSAASAGQAGFGCESAELFRIACLSSLAGCSGCLGLPLRGCRALWGLLRIPMPCEPATALLAYTTPFLKESVESARKSSVMGASSLQDECVQRHSLDAKLGSAVTRCPMQALPPLPPLASPRRRGSTPRSGRRPGP